MAEKSPPPPPPRKKGGAPPPPPKKQAPPPPGPPPGKRKAPPPPKKGGAPPPPKGKRPAPKGKRTAPPGNKPIPKRRDKPPQSAAPLLRVHLNAPLQRSRRASRKHPPRGRRKSAGAFELNWAFVNQRYPRKARDIKTKLAGHRLEPS